MKKFLLPLALTVFAFASCSKDNVGITPEPPVFGEPTSIELKIINESNPASRGLNGKEDGVGDENKITMLEFYVFDSTGNNRDPKVGGGDGYLKVGDGVQPITKLTHTIVVSGGNDKKFIVVANSNLGTSSGDKYDDILKKINTYEYPGTPTSTDNPRTIRQSGFEMSGTKTATISDGASNQVYITIFRSVSKINQPTIPANVTVKLLQEQLDELWGQNSGVDTDTDISFAFDGYTVVNGNKSSNVSFVGNAAGYYKDPKDSPWNTWTAKTNINSAFGPSGEYTNNYTGEIGSGWFITNNTTPVYVYENKPVWENGTNENDGYKAGSVYALIIEGTLTPDAGSGEPAKTRYWRVNLTADDYYHVMRNCVYNVKINKITSPGFNTPEEAENPDKPVPPVDSASTDFVISIAQWDVNDYETDM